MDNVAELKSMLERIALLREARAFDSASDATYSLGCFMESNGPSLLSELSRLRALVAQIAAEEAVGVYRGITGGVHDCAGCRHLIALAASAREGKA